MALYLKKELEDSKTTIAVWQITETEEQLKEMSSTPTDEMEEISFIKSESLRKQRLAVRALLNELFDEFRKRGIYLDKQSQESIVEFYEKLNLIEKKSDSGDAQYVKGIL